MMRRVVRPAPSAAVGVRSISNYSFGHPTLTENFPGSFIEKQPASDKGVELIQLSNGAKCIAAQATGIQQSIGIFVEAGPKFDPMTAPGLSYVMRWALPCSNMENSLFQIDRNLRAYGVAQEHCEVDKKWVGWKVEGFPGGWKTSFYDLLTCLSAPRFPEADVERFRDTMDNIHEENRWQTPRIYAVDQLETVAFFREPLGHSRHVLPESNDLCSSNAMIEHWSKYFVPTRTIIAGVNIAADELAAIYENAPFPHSEQAPHHQRSDKKFLDHMSESTQYQPGAERHEFESRPKAMNSKPEMDEETIVAMGFRAYGRDQSVKEYATSLIVHQLIDMALEDGIRYDRSMVHRGPRSFYRSFASTGLVGFTVRDEPSAIAAATLNTAKLVRDITASNDTLGIAKERAKVAFFNNELEMGRDRLDHLVRSIKPGTNNYISPEEYFTNIDQVTDKEVNSALGLIKSEKPTVFATGQTNSIPSVRQMGF